MLSVLYLYRKNNTSSNDLNCNIISRLKKYIYNGIPITIKINKNNFEIDIKTFFFDLSEAIFNFSLKMCIRDRIN